MYVDSGESFFEKFAFKMVEKHIAGKTLSAALAKALEMNEKNMLADLSFLTEIPDNRAKASYVTNTYMQLARQMGRFGIKGSMHIPIEQLGSHISAQVALEGIEKIEQTCKHYKTFPWYEVRALEEMPIARKITGGDFGIATNDYSIFSSFAKTATKSRGVKMVFANEKGAKEFLGDGKNAGDGRNTIKSALPKTKSISVMCPTDKIVEDILKIGKSAEKITFEFELGESEKRLSKIAKKGMQVSMYMPFGKDWVRYAIDKVPEGHIRSFASDLIKPKDMEDA